MILSYTVPFYILPVYQNHLLMALKALSNMKLTLRLPHFLKQKYLWYSERELGVNNSPPLY